MPFDPYSLPREPTIAIDIRVDDRGVETAAVDGRPVPTGTGESARTAAVRAVAELVDELAGRTPDGRSFGGLRARINGPGFTDYEVVIDRHGRLFVPIGLGVAPAEPTPPQAGPRASAPPSDTAPTLPDSPGPASGGVPAAPDTPVAETAPAPGEAPSGPDAPVHPPAQVTEPEPATVPASEMAPASPVAAEADPPPDPSARQAAPTPAGTASPAPHRRPPRAWSRTFVDEDPAPEKGRSSADVTAPSGDENAPVSPSDRPVRPGVTPAGGAPTPGAGATALMDAAHDRAGRRPSPRHEAEFPTDTGPHDRHSGTGQAPLRSALLQRRRLREQTDAEPPEPAAPPAPATPTELDASMGPAEAEQKATAQVDETGGADAQAAIQVTSPAASPRRPSAGFGRPGRSGEDTASPSARQRTTSGSALPDANGQGPERASGQRPEGPASTLLARARQRAGLGGRSSTTTAPDARRATPAAGPAPDGPGPDTGTGESVPAEAPTDTDATSSDAISTIAGLGREQCAPAAGLAAAPVDPRRGAPGEPMEPGHPSDRIGSRDPRPAEAGQRAIPALGRTQRPAGFTGEPTEEVVAGPRRLHLRPAVVIVIVAAVLSLAGLGAIAAALLNFSETPAATSSRPTAVGRELPGTPPPGWQVNSRWVSPPLQSGVPALDLGDAVGYVTSAHRMAVVDATTGDLRWGTALPPGTVTALARTRIDDTDVVAAQVGTQLSWWRIRDGRLVGSIDLPSGARTTFLGDSPLLGLSSNTVGVLRDGKIREVRVPDGAYPLAAAASGRVTAARGDGWWHLRPGVDAGRVHPWEDAAPDEQAPGTTAEIVGYTGDSVITAYPPDRTGVRHVVVHTDRAYDIRVSFRGRIEGPDAKADSWHPSPTGTWGVLGRTLVDLRRGSVTDLGAWTTKVVTADAAYGTASGDVIQASPGRALGVVPADTLLPELVTDAGAAVRTTVNRRERLYLLPPS